MDRVGIFADDERVELIEGEIVKMSPIGSVHQWLVDWLNMLLAPALVGRAIVRVQGPMRLGDLSQPQPDLLVLRQNRYFAEHPLAPDVLLAIEVSDSSRAFDRNVKRPLYATHGVHELWLFDIAHQLVEVSRDPADGAYAQTVIAAVGETIHPYAFPDVAIIVAEAFPDA